MLGETKVKGIGCKSRAIRSLLSRSLPQLPLHYVRRRGKAMSREPGNLLKHPVQCFQRKSSAEMLCAYVGIDVCVHFFGKVDVFLLFLTRLFAFGRSE